MIFLFIDILHLQDLLCMFDNIANKHKCKCLKYNNIYYRLQSNVQETS